MRHPAWSTLSGVIMALILFGPGFGRASEAGSAPPPPSPADPPGISLRRVVLPPGQDWPGTTLRPNGLAWNWGDATALSLDVANGESRPVPLFLRVDDDALATNSTHSLTTRIDLAPRQRVELLLPLDIGQSGMLAGPSGPDAAAPGRLLLGQTHGRIDPRHVVALRLSSVRSEIPVHLLVGDPHPVAIGGWRVRYRGMADAYGQRVGGAWPEKVASDQALARRQQAAQAEVDAALRAAPVAADRYGGLEGGPVFDATGFFRVQRDRTRWWLVTPEGHAFFSIGVDAVVPSGFTPVAGRAALFASLPDGADRLSRYYGPDGRRDWFDIYAANLDRGLGPDWPSLWPDRTLRRLRAWGFNTLGNWSDPGLWAAHALPYVTELGIRAPRVVPMGAGHAVPDPFDPGFPQAADAAAARQAAARGADPWLIGTFAGNELPWFGGDRGADRLAAQVLRQAADSPAKRAFVTDLQARYGDISGLARAWGASPAASWAAMLAMPVELPARATPALTADLARFEAAFADRYFRVVAEALRRRDPHHLFLGSRFAAWTPEAVRACARWCDVLSFNLYARSPEGKAAALWRVLDRPVLIGEFHFGSLDRGSFWPGLVDAGSEQARGPAYAAYLADAAADPAIVGAHWFKYADEPLTGRPWDGENGHIGLVTITDLPYAPFVGAVTAANRDALARLAAMGGKAGPSGWQPRSRPQG